MSDITMLSEDDPSIYWKPDSPHVKSTTQVPQKSNFNNKYPGNFSLPPPSVPRPCVLTENSVSSTVSPTSSLATGILQHLKKSHNTPPTVLQSVTNSASKRVVVNTQKDPSTMTRSHTSRSVNSPIDKEQNVDRGLQNRHLPKQTSLPLLHEEKTVSKSSSLPYNKVNTNNCDSPQLYQACYNPHLYSSSKKNKPVRQFSINQETEDPNTTPVNRNKGMKQVIPRAVNFNQESPINIHTKKSFDANKENIPCDIPCGMGEENDNNQLVPFRKMSSTDSPDQLVCKIIENKDQQIFLLQKNIITAKDERIAQLLTDLEKKEEQIQKLISSHLSKQEKTQPCNFFHSPTKTIIHKDAQTQTSCQDEFRSTTRTVGVNTDLAWSKMESSSQDLCIETKKSGNLSSVRFEQEENEAKSCKKQCNNPCCQDSDNALKLTQASEFH